MGNTQWDTFTLRYFLANNPFVREQATSKHLFLIILIPFNIDLLFTKSRNTEIIGQPFLLNNLRSDNYFVWMKEGVKKKCMYECFFLFFVLDS